MESETPPPSPSRLPLTFLALLAIAGCGAAASLWMRVAMLETQNATLLASVEQERQHSAELQAQMDAFEKEATAATAQLAQRERALSGREDAATERTQTAFQGLMIQQQLLQNLERLKASFPELTPEVEKIAKENAQLTEERDRLRKENATLRGR